jgi:hypothetical protein
MDSLERPTSLVFRLRRSRLDALKELSRETRILQSKYLREALSDLLDKYGHQREPKGASAGMPGASARSMSGNGSSVGG